MDNDAFIERRIVIGLIVSTTYIDAVRKKYKPKLLSSASAKMLAQWCFDYYDKYREAPGKDIQSVFTNKIQTMNTDKVEDVEEILRSLSDDYSESQFNINALRDDTLLYFRKRNALVNSTEVLEAAKAGDVDRAEKIAASFSTIQEEDAAESFPFERPDKFKTAFEALEAPLIVWPGKLGTFWNEEFVPGGFIGLMGPEKVGKTWTEIECGIRGLESGNDVAFFSVGDMTEDQVYVRLGVRLVGRSNKEKHCGPLYLPVPDCVLNQTDNCENTARKFQTEIPFPDKQETWFELEVNMPELVTAYKKCNTGHKNYTPCTACTLVKYTPWLTMRKPVKPLTWQEAYKAGRDFMRKAGARFKLSTHSNESLNVLTINRILDRWAKEGFFPKILCIDYPDVMDADPDCTRLPLRDQINKTWQRLRRIAQHRHSLIIVPTQTDANSYMQMWITRQNFSDDKRKLAHVTAMYGLNQLDREGQIGIMRINQVAVREDEYSMYNYVTVLNRLQAGMPLLTSY